MEQWNTERLVFKGYDSFLILWLTQTLLLTLNYVIPKPIIPLFQASIIPTVSEAN
jgi:hypothetical protein